VTKLLLSPFPPWPHGQAKEERKRSATKKNLRIKEKRKKEKGKEILLQSWVISSKNAWRSKEGSEVTFPLIYPEEWEEMPTCYQLTPGLKKQKRKLRERSPEE